MDKNSLIYTLLHLKGWGAKKVYSYVYTHSFDFESCVNGLDLYLTDDEKFFFDYQLKKSSEILKKNYDLGIKACSILDDYFPKKLYDKTDSCVFLFYKGNIELLNEKSITIIGTRNVSDSFAEKGKIITDYFSKKGYVIVSGLANGSDAIAHSSCLAVGGRTIAVLPSSCGDIMPKSNNNLANDILGKEGLLISEYSITDKIDKYNYAQRDRIQSFLSNVIIVIQSENTGGTMIAVKRHIKDKKLVYAIKGNNLTLINNYIDVDSENDLLEIEKAL